MESHAHNEAAWLLSLTSSEQSQLLLRLAHGLTIGIRVLCHAGQEAGRNLESVRLLNEASHRVVGYLLPSEVRPESQSRLVTLIESLLSISDEAASQQASQAWSYARQSTAPASAA